MFSLDQFVSDARAAAAAPEPLNAVISVMAETLADPEVVRANMPGMVENEVLLFEDDTVSIWHERFLHTEILPPHDHQTHAVLGVYHGRERNGLFRRVGGQAIKGGELVLGAGQFHVFGPDDIHSVQGLDGTPSLGLHIYLGPLTRIERSLFDWETGAPVPLTEDAFTGMIRAA